MFYTVNLFDVNDVLLWVSSGVCQRSSQWVS